MAYSCIPESKLSASGFFLLEYQLPWCSLCRRLYGMQLRLSSKHFMRFNQRGCVPRWWWEYPMWTSCVNQLQQHREADGWSTISSFRNEGKAAHFSCHKVKLLVVFSFLTILAQNVQKYFLFLRLSFETSELLGIKKRFNRPLTR